MTETCRWKKIIFKYKLFIFLLSKLWKYDMKSLIGVNECPKNKFIYIYVQSFLEFVLHCCKVCIYHRLRQISLRRQLAAVQWQRNARWAKLAAALGIELHRRSYHPANLPPQYIFFQAFILPYCGICLSYQTFVSNFYIWWEARTASRLAV